MSGDRLQTPQQATKRTVLRVAGITTLLVGAALTLTGFASLFSSFGSFGPPRYFWCAFLGLPLVAAGGFMTTLGFLGAFQRYIAGETAPVAKDVVNFMGEKTQPGVKSFAKAVTQGIKEGLDEDEESQKK